MKPEVLYKIRGIPATYYGQEIKGVPARVDKIKNMVYNLPDKAIKLYTYGQIGGLIPLLDDKYGSDNVIGLSYREYFTSMFKDTNVVIPKAKVLILYDVGLEKALNLDFSSRVLQGLIKHLSNNNQHLILNSEMPYSKFTSRYGILFNNVLNVPTVEDIKLDI